MKTFVAKLKIEKYSVKSDLRESITEFWHNLIMWMEILWNLCTFLGPKNLIIEAILLPLNFIAIIRLSVFIKKRGNVLVTSTLHTVKLKNH